MNLLIVLIVVVAFSFWFDDRRKERASLKRAQKDAANKRKKRLAQLDGCWRQADKEAFKGNQFRR